ncbi:hypothetical protein PHJA_001375200 [Phtheirospermum japonicum]|uniref:Uncharacterized protein n=1 Tax=Phtheirospermum japonicum TaxID=374723 RepID=A0A830CDG5_9LAMI|nr:hypothetical protein PHJA_001375200 [Phtheirospermum japonicum]
METLIVAHHRNQHQYYSRNRRYSSTKFGSFGSPPSGNFRGINCRTFQTGEGLLPTPSKQCSTKTSITEKTFLASFSPKTPSPSVNENRKASKGISKSNTIAIPINFKTKNNKRDFFSERWAGPAYSNSPSPSSLPIPKFSMNPKRTVSLDLPTVASEFDMHPIAKSAPASPTRERSLSPCDRFDISVSATLTLRRILNLDGTD